MLFHWIGLSHSAVYPDPCLHLRTNLLTPGRCWPSELIGSSGGWPILVRTAEGGKLASEIRVEDQIDEHSGLVAVAGPVISTRRPIKPAPGSRVPFQTVSGHLNKKKSRRFVLLLRPNKHKTMNYDANRWRPGSTYGPLRSLRLWPLLVAVPHQLANSQVDERPA